MMRKKRRESLTFLSSLRVRLRLRLWEEASRSTKRFGVSFFFFVSPNSMVKANGSNLLASSSSCTIAPSGAPAAGTEESKELTLLLVTAEELSESLLKSSFSYQRNLIIKLQYQL